MLLTLLSVGQFAFSKGFLAAPAGPWQQCWPGRADPRSRGSSSGCAQGVDGHREGEATA